MADKSKPAYQSGDKFRLSPVGKERYPKDTHELILTVEHVCNRYGPVDDPDPTSHPAYAGHTLYEPAEDSSFPFALIEEEMEKV